ncbi:MAG: hypothetical protein WA101_01300 [Minisyncoccia bacterium]
MLKGKKFLVIIVFVLVLVFVSIYYYLSLNKQGQVAPTNLTEEERAAILNELNAGGNANLPSTTEKNDIIKNLGSTSTNNTQTDTEREAIINSLNQ